MPAEVLQLSARRKTRMWANAVLPDETNGIDCGISSPVASTEQPGFLVHVAHGTEIAPHNLKIGVLPHVVLGHLEHAQVEIGYGAEGATCYEDDWGFG